MIVLVVTAYGLPGGLIDRFVELNHAAARSFGASIVVVTDKPRIIDAPCVWRVNAPQMDIFSICRCSNIGIKKAQDLAAYTIVKTDIDCILSVDAWLRIAQVKSGCGCVFRYWQIDDYGDRDSATLDPRIMGTCAFTAKDWDKMGGYNADMQGYGYDDADIIYRAKAQKIKVEQYKKVAVYHIRHAEKHNRDTINPVMRGENLITAGKSKKHLDK